MESTELLDPRRKTWGVAAKVCVTLVVGFAAVGWLLLSLIFWGFRCDDTCGPGDAESWKWTGQLMLAAAGSALAILGVAFGFTSRRVAHQRLLIGGGGCALVWFVWVLGSGTF